MTSANALTDTVALLLFQKIKEGMENGRIADIKAVQVEVDDAIDELNNRRPIGGSDHINDLIGEMILEIGSLREKVAKCETRVAECQSRAKVPKEETIQIVARTDACNLLVEQHQKENGKVLAVMEGRKASTSAAPPPCHAPAPSPADPASYPAASRMAVVSFPGGPRTITIHPPTSPNYQSTIRDDNGDVVITLKDGKSLRREGAFRGAIEEIDWHQIYRSSGRGPDLTSPRLAPPTSYRPDRSQPSRAPSRSASDNIARQYELSVSNHTDAFGRVPPAEHLAYAKSPLLTGISSSQPSKDTRSGSSAKPDTSTPCSAPPFPSVGRGKKRTQCDDDEGVPEARERDSLTQDPTTPTPVKREAFQMLEVPGKRKKPRLSASSEALSVAPLFAPTACSTSRAPIDGDGAST